VQALLRVPQTSLVITTTFLINPPPQVSAADDDECGRRANSEAWESINRKNDYSYMFGALGVSLDFLFMNSQVNTKYEQVMKSCLREKGYKIPD
jgi:hypothetical protein